MMYLTREERLLPLNSIFNTRDLGGYETQEGSFTKTHKYIRAATPAHLSEEDKAYLYNYGVRVIIDLRGENEILQAPNQMKDYKDVQYYHVDVFGDKNAAVVPQNDIEFKDMGDLYCIMLDQLQPNLKKVFDLFLKHIDQTILFHCSAGKDRTGVISALLLDLAGYHAYDIVKDYSESFENNKPIYDELLKIASKENQHLLLSDPLFMLKMLDHLSENYGSARTYLKEIGLSEEEVDKLFENFTI